MSDNDPMAEIRASFFVECEELLEGLQDGLSAMDSGADDSETINICFRAVHSIKGGAGAFGLDQLVRFAHRYETVMDEIRGGNLSPDREAMLLFFRAADILSDIVMASRNGNDLPADDVEETLKALEALVDVEEDIEEDSVPDFQPMGLALDMDLGGAEDDGQSSFTVEFKPERELFASGNEPLHLLRSLSELGEASITCDIDEVPLLDNLDPTNAYLWWTIDLATDASEDDITETFDFVEGLCTLTVKSLMPVPELPSPDSFLADLIDHVEPETTNDAQSSEAPETVKTTDEPTKPAKVNVAPKATVRVDLERIDRLVNLVGELVINQAMLSQSVAEAGIANNTQVTTGLEEFMQLTRDIQDSVMMIRAQPVKSLLQRMSRIVREASAAIGKHVDFVTEGENTEVDKTVIERLADPLTHMIRNAVDHGLESGEDRIAAGKPREGRVTLSAAHKSGRVVIEVSDDGGGINRPKVQQIAVDKGLIPAGQELSDAEIDGLLFLPGFSTAKEVSDLSGRGVGMDVVRSAIQALGGRISIVSEPSLGTTFSISLPLTLAVLDGMVVKVAAETLVVPLGVIVETVSLQEGDVRTVSPGNHVIHIRDTFVPIVDLGSELGYREAYEDFDGCVVLLIAGEDGSRTAVVVDAIEEQRQVVIKGLQEGYGRIPGIAAATILGDGKIALILDPVDLISNASGRKANSNSSFKLAG